MSLQFSGEFDSDDIHNQIEFIYKKVKDKELTEYEKKLLKEFDKIWDEYEKTKANKESLYGIFSLLSNKNSKKMIMGMDSNQSFLNPFQGIFSESVSIKELINAVVKFAKGKSKTESKFIKVKKGIQEKLTQFLDKTSFSVKLDDSQKQIFLKRKKYLSAINYKMLNSIKTKVISYSSNGNQYNNLDLFHSILYAVESGSFSNKPVKIVVNSTHFRYPVYSFKQDFNIMMVLDTSNSVSWITHIIDKVIALVTNSAKNSNDKLGLITFNNDTANLIHHPTKNINQIIGSVNNSNPKGFTPLSEGLRKAVNVLSQNRYNLPGMANAIILISDCYPEPLTYKHKDLMEEPVCKEFIFECEKIAEKKIKFLLINPILNDSKVKKDRIGYRLANLGVEKANGNLINLKGRAAFDYIGRMRVSDIDRTFEKNMKDQLLSMRNSI